MIEVTHLSKSYMVKGREIPALTDISLSIPKGEIFGIIGHSGAGKSTLVRCFNLLERPNRGQVLLDNVDLTALNSAQLRQERRKIGMIFQHFNLFSSQTIFENIAFPLKLEGVDRASIKRRVEELLALVNLSEHADKYPAQLSGGQKQRVGIARALANNPKVLLCDEATSALDPQTTQSILELLVQINRKLNLTIVLITHEMEVIRAICDRVAIIHNSKIIESGPVEEIFLHPKEQITQQFIVDQSQLKSLKRDIERLPDLGSLYQITYLGDTTFAPHLSDIIKESRVQISILSGSISYIRELPYGQLIVALNGSVEEKRDALSLLSQHDIQIHPFTLQKEQEQ